MAQKKGARVLALTNVGGSSIDREADQVLYLRAGPEIAVASTKAYSTMVTAFYMLGLYLGTQEGIISEARGKDLLRNLLCLPDLASRVIRE